MARRQMMSARQWIAAGVLALVALFVARDAMNRAQERYARVTAPKSALKRTPTDMFAFQKAVDADLAAGNSRPISARDVRMARAALTVSPINAPAFRILGMYAEQAGDDTKAAEAFLFSEKISRRNMFVQLWLIEYSVGKGNVAEALKHYDAALSVRPALSDALFPVLSAAIADPLIRTALRPYVVRKAPWAGSLLSYATLHSDPHHVMALLVPLAPRLRGNTFDDVSQTLANRLVDTGDVTAAIQVVAWHHPKAASTLKTLAVSRETLDPQLGVFAWRWPDEQGLDVSSNNQQGFDVTARPLASGVAAIRVMPVSTGGRYIFQQKLRTEASLPATYHWQATCIGRSDNKAFFDQQVFPGDQVQRWTMSIPQGCRGIRLALRIDGPDGQSSPMASVTDLALSPLS